MIHRRAFQVGGHTFLLDFPAGMLSERDLKPYTPFQTDSYCVADRRYDSEEDVLFALTLVDDAETLAHKVQVTATFNNENGRMAVCTADDGSLLFSLHTVSGRECCRIHISQGLHEAKVWIGGTTGERRYALDTALMLLYAIASSNRETLLLHASAVEYDGKGYLFLGRSGTGKSTHSRLWIEHIKGSELLNDDNPILRIIAGDVYVYGSPWSGKCPCYRNHHIPVGGIVRLHQGDQNSIIALKGVKAYAALQSSCSYLKWDKEMGDAVHNTLSRIIEIVPVYGLECRPDPEAALICKEALK